MKKVRHGLSRTRLYRKYVGMKTRCYCNNEQYYKDYGGRGIKVCDEWLGKYGFTNFAKWAFENGYSEEKGDNGKTILTLDRIDVNGDYTPSNCRWVTNQEQQNNKRDNVFLEFNGKKQTMMQWARELGVGFRMIENRIKRGWSVEKTLTTPPKLNQYQEGIRATNLHLYQNS